MDSDGDVKWSYGRPSYNSNNMLYYKNIDANIDMIIAASGDSDLKLTRIISSITDPYLVDPVSKNYLTSAF